jgi:energy-coupling factor transporter transmembrane protein EcfT
MRSLNINPIVLIIINIIAPSMYIFLSGKYLQIFLLIFAASLLALMGRYKRVAALFIVYFVLIGIYVVTLRSDDFKFIGLFFIVLAQSVPCVSLAALLISKYNSAQLLSALEAMRIPRILVVAVTITMKYIPTFKREFGYILESMRLRGIKFTWRRPVKSFQYFIAPQLFRCAALAEEVTSAGLVKGIDAPVRRSSFYEEKITIADYLVLFVFVLGLVGGFVWQKM